MRESEKRLSQNIYERGVDDAGFGHIRSKGDRALFGGYTTQEMKERLGVKDNRQLADFLPTLSIAAKNLAAEMTNYNVEEKDLQGESAITGEHVQRYAWAARHSAGEFTCRRRHQKTGAARKIAGKGTGCTVRKASLRKRGG